MKAALSAGVTLLLCASAAFAQEPAKGPEVLKKGPLHEAFAAPVTFNPEGPPVIAKAPPPQVEEVAPEPKPEGDNVQWIGGYWAWDEERKDYIWVSGVWRAVPPGKSWVGGRWKQVEGGFQWVPGYWSSAGAGSAGASATATVEVKQAPPQSLESGPTSDPPTSD
jgi:hypothetical protein